MDAPEHARGSEDRACRIASEAPHAVRAIREDLQVGPVRPRSARFVERRARHPDGEMSPTRCCRSSPRARARRSRTVMRSPPRSRGIPKEALIKSRLRNEPDRASLRSGGYARGYAPSFRVSQRHLLGLPALRVHSPWSPHPGATRRTRVSPCAAPAHAPGPAQAGPHLQIAAMARSVEQLVPVRTGSTNSM